MMACTRYQGPLARCRLGGVLLFSWMLACAPPVRSSDGGEFGAGAPGGDATGRPDPGTSDEPEPEPGPTSTGEGAPDEPPVVFDVGTIPEPPAPDAGCDAVDFLFVIDNSATMGLEQENLVANFPAFIGGIQSTLQDVDSYHVGIVTTDAYGPNTDACSDIGGLVVRTGGEDSSQTNCGPYASGANFITEEDDLEAAFSCAARVGTDGDPSERPMTAVREALSIAMSVPGACNEGFLRDDALLVVVVISDEADGPGDPEAFLTDGTSTGTPQLWRDTVVAAKQGIAENAVALVLANYHGGACEPFDEMFDGANLVEFAELFGDNGFVGGICERDYAPLFAQAVDVVSSACAGFVPPG